MKCESCGAEIHSIKTSFFSNGPQSEIECECPLQELGNGAVSFQVDYDWVGYNLDNEERGELILCPVCGKQVFSSDEAKQIETVIKIERGWMPSNVDMYYNNKKGETVK